MISAVDIEAFKEENDMGIHKDVLLQAEQDLTSMAQHAAPRPQGLMKLIKPALTLMAELPVDSYLIGGSLRDVVNGKRIRDFDIYVGPDFDVSMLDAMGYDGSNITLGAEYLGQVAWGQCNFDRKLHGVVEIDPNPAGWDAVAMPEPKLQIMILKEWFKTPEAAARSVDFGICQIVYNLKSGLYATPEFFRDSINRTFTFMPEGRSDNDKLRSVKRFERLNADKYQGYRCIGLDMGVNP